MTERAFNWSAVGAAVSVACAVSVTALVLHREMTGRTAWIRPRAIADYSPSEVKNWDSLVSLGHRFGPPSAGFVVIEFADFQCEACRKFAISTVGSLRKAYPQDVAVVYRHWPLPYHKHAHAAAQAAECADAQGVFEEMHDRLFLLQDSIGIKSFEEFGRDAGVLDSSAFAECLTTADSSAALIDIGVVQGLGGRGTPTVLINGQLLDGVPDSAAMHAIFRKHRKRVGK